MKTTFNGSISVVLIMIFCFMLFPVMAYAEDIEIISGECGDLSWEIDSSTLTISGSGEMSDFDSEGAAPWYEYKDSISSLIISDGVTSIGEYAFSGCSTITSIRFYGAQPDSIGSNAFEGITANVLYHHDYSFTSDNYGGDLTYVKTCNGSSYEEVEDEAAEQTCTDAGHEAGTYCSVCKETLTGRETIDAKGHDLIHHTGKAPTYTEVGWEVYDTCSRCDYTTYKEIAKLDGNAKYSITYVLNGGRNNANNPATYTYNSSTITLLNPVRDGYAFLGWFQDTGFTKRITEIRHGSSGSVTLYAKWEKGVWKTIDGSIYYVFPNGVYASGWHKIDNEWYYFKTSNNKLAVNGWAQDRTGWMWMDESGKITKSKWIQTDGEWYYLKSNGYMAANEWAKDRTGWMWMDLNGKITMDRWIQPGGEWYYLKSNGYMAATEWAKDRTGWMWMDSSGKITKDKWVQPGGEWYYLKANGYMAASEWAKDKAGWMYMDSSGKITKNKWIQSSGKWYYLKPNGYMAADEWAKDSSNWWYLKPDGSMETDTEPIVQRAAGYVSKLTSSSMTKQEKLRACFNTFYKGTYNNPWMPHYTGMDWPQKYAGYSYSTDNLKGNCMSRAAGFAYMAKALGYENIYCYHGVMGSRHHAFVEIDGLLYDPQHAKSTSNHSNYFFGFEWGSHLGLNGWDYVKSIASGYSWMRVKN